MSDKALPFGEFYGKNTSSGCPLRDAADGWQQLPSGQSKRDAAQI